MEIFFARASFCLAAVVKTTVPPAFFRFLRPDTDTSFEVLPLRASGGFPRLFVRILPALPLILHSLELCFAVFPCLLLFARHELLSRNGNIITLFLLAVPVQSLRTHALLAPLQMVKSTYLLRLTLLRILGPHALLCLAVPNFADLAIFLTLFSITVPRESSVTHAPLKDCTVILAILLVFTVY